MTRSTLFKVRSGASSVGTHSFHVYSQKLDQNKKSRPMTGVNNNNPKKPGGESTPVELWGHETNSGEEPLRLQRPCQLVPASLISSSSYGSLNPANQ
jgi:hypothetical protein